MRTSNYLNRALAVAMATLTLVGCQSASPSRYSSPRITERVLNAQTQQPIPGVQVRRLTPQDPSVDQAIKGGQNLDKSPAVRTDSEGRFVLVSQKQFALFSRLGWYSVNVAFTHPSYERLTTEYTLVNATNTSHGEPLVAAGNSPLQPKPKSAIFDAQTGRNQAGTRFRRAVNLLLPRFLNARSGLK